APPAPKAEEKAPPKGPPPRAERPPERAPERVVEPLPPRAPDVTTARPKSIDPSELALPRRAEKEIPVTPATPRPVERTLLPPPPPNPPTRRAGAVHTATARAPADRRAARGPCGSRGAAEPDRSRPARRGSDSARPAQRNDDLDGQHRRRRQRLPVHVLPAPHP